MGIGATHQRTCNQAMTSPPDFVPHILTALEKGRSRWPTFAVNERAFAERLSLLEAQWEGGSFEEEALYLVQGCLDGNEKAHRELENLLWEQLALLSHFRLSVADQNEVHQQVLTSLLVAPDEHSMPRLAQYSGKGTLNAWLHMTLLRATLDRLRREKRTVPVDDELLLGQPADSVDLDLHVLKQRHAGQFSAAFRRAIRKLTSRQRNLLRQHHLDGLTFEDLGLMYRVHRSTAANWLTEAKQDLLMHTRDEISELTGLPRLAVDSLMRLLQSQLDISTGVFLSAENAAATSHET